MKSGIIATTFLLSSTVLAAPFNPDHRPMRSVEHIQNQSPPRKSKTLPPIYDTGSSRRRRMNHHRDSGTVYSANWAGAVQISENITHVTANVTFPQVSMPAGGNPSTQYGGSVWVGIDGDTCQNAILQGGIDWYIQNGQPIYQAWYEWFPEPSYLFNITVNPGDEIHMAVTSHASTRGTVHIQNLSTNEHVKHHFENQTTPLCNTNAEWIVEDFSVADSTGKYGLIPFSSFSPVTISDAQYVHTAQNVTAGVTGAQMMDIQQDGNTLTSCTAQGDNTLVCDYVGGGSGQQSGNEYA